MDTQFVGIYSCEYLTFDIYFSSLMSLQVHPGAGEKGHKALSMEECRDKAIQMLILRRSIPVLVEQKIGEE
jgi:hypothetical protein